MPKEGTDYTLTIQMLNGENYKIQYISTFDDIDSSFKDFVAKIHYDRGIYHYDRSKQKNTYIPLTSIVFMECSLED